MKRQRPSFKTTRATPVSEMGRMDRPPGVHRHPATLFEDAVKRSLGWRSEDELRDLVERYTGVKLSLGEANRLSQEVAALAYRMLTSKGDGERRPVVTDGKGNGLYADEVCDAGTCCRPPGHSGRHDQFDGPCSADSVPLHPIGSSE